MIKRIVDLFFSTMGLVILSPIFIILAIWIKRDSVGPIFFRQARVGQYGIPFNIFKFRTMVVDSTFKGPLITVSEDRRITKIGKVLRHYKLDELPQLINVFKGEMSLVGPRPEVPRYVEMFKKEYDAVLRVKPGITDYAAIEFRDEENILKSYPDPEDGYCTDILPKKIQLYKKYLKNRNFFVDLKIIILTIRNIAK